MSYRIALIDDHPLFRQGMRALIDREVDMEVVSEGTDGRGAHDIAKTVSPDVMVMDLVLQDGDGISVGRDIVRSHPTIRLLALSMHRNEFFVSRALDAGFLGYAFKTQPPDEVVGALRRIAEGVAYLPDAYQHLVAPRASGPAGSPRPGGRFNDLSRREREVFDLILRGRTNQQIAGNLFISIKTVETHRSHINRKLNVHSTGELIRLSALSGLLEN
jgi:two-component system, NarL family, response regulator NreC